MTKKADSLSTVRFFVSALPIFPGRVRDGNGWTLTAINTDCVTASFLSFALPCGQRSFHSLRLSSKSKPLRWFLIWS